jgi:hypothetical protein
MGSKIRQSKWSKREDWRDGLRAGAPPVVFVSVLMASLLLRCAVSERDPALFTARAAEAGGAGGFGTLGGGEHPNGTGGLAIQLFTGTGGFYDAGRIFACAVATVERDCPLPPSECGVGLSLAYYTDAVCVENTCQWTRHTTNCDRGCTNGGCMPSFTAVPAGAIDSGAECTPGDASACDDLPASYCLDRRNLLYFTNARCVDGKCQSDSLTKDCGETGCHNGGCQYPLTTH